MTDYEDRKGNGVKGIIRNGDNPPTSSLFDLFSSPSSEYIIEVLLTRHSNEKFTTEEIARHAGVSLDEARENLETFAKYQVVEPTDNQGEYKIPEYSIVFSHLLQLNSMMNGLRSGDVNTLSSNPDPDTQYHQDNFCPSCGSRGYIVKSYGTVYNLFECFNDCGNWVSLNDHPQNMTFQNIMMMETDERDELIEKANSDEETLTDREKYYADILREVRSD